MENDFTYYAFISYSHKDETWAKWIQEAIEHYRLPAIIRKEAQKQLPKKIAPVFRDATDLGVDVLVDGLHEELEKSRFLIVVCSPNSAKPNAEGKHFVDGEVRHFCELGRTKQIIPVIIEGTPEESFGPVLKSKEILALDATKQSKARILNDIVAKILGLKPDALWRRAERERTKRLIIRSIMCGILGLAAAFIGLFAWDANRTVKNYYADYVDSFGLPEGIFPLKKSELKGRYVHYRFEYRGFQYGKSPHADSADWCIWNLFGFRRRLVRMVQANSHGYPRKWNHTEYSDRPLIQDFKYDRDLRLREIRYGRYNGEGRVPHLEKRIELSNAGAVNGLLESFSNEGRLAFAYGVASMTALDPTVISEPSKSEITKYLVKRDGQGRVTQKLFLDNSGANVPDGDGLRGCSYEHDYLGRQTTQCYIAREEDGFRRSHNKKGISGKKYWYVGRNLEKIECVDVNGHSIRCSHGWMICEKHFDGAGNEIGEWYLDESGNRTLNADGYAGTKTEYDAEGNLIYEVALNIYGKPTLIKDGFAGSKMEYDDCGNIVSRMFLGKNGELVLTKYGFAKMCHKYDERGNEIKVSFWGLDDKPILNKMGFAALMFEYDQLGNETKRICLGIDNNPILSKEGCAEVRTAYDEHQHTKTSAQFLGVNGEPVYGKNGFAKICWEYDPRGNVIKESYYDINGKSTPHKDGYAELRMEYDASGNKVEVKYFGIKGEPVFCKAGYAVAKTEYEHGNETRMSFFDVEGNPVLSLDGYATIEWERDDCGRIKRESYFDNYGQPTLMHVVSFNIDAGESLGYSSVSMDYDDYGNILSKTFYGTKKERVLQKDGVSCIRYSYDQYSNMKEEIYYDIDGNIVQSKQGVAIIRSQYDGFGNETNRSYYGVKDEPISDTNGVFQICYEYDQFCNKTHTKYLDSEGNFVTNRSDGCSSIRYEYDQVGNRVKESFSGLDGRLIDTKKGWAEVELLYDYRGNVVQQIHRDKNGIFKSCDKFEYDNCGRITRMFFVDEFGCKTLNAALGIAEGRIEYDERGKMVKLSFLDERGGLVSHEGTGYAEARMEYDKYGHKTKVSFWGRDAEPILHNGYSVLSMSYDKAGNNVYEQYYGTNGIPIMVNGYASCRRTFDVRRRETSCIWYDDEGNVIVRDEENGVPWWMSMFDDFGNEVRRDYMGKDGKKTTTKDGVESKCSSYDAKGRLIRGDLYAPSGIGGIWGYTNVHHICRLYDVYGNETNISFWSVGEVATKGWGNVHSICSAFRRYGEVDKCARRWYLDVRGNATVGENGIAENRFEYDLQGHLVRVNLYALSGLGGIWGYTNVHHVCRSYDVYGNETNMSFLAVGDIRTTIDGASEIRILYDQHNVEMCREHYDIHGTKIALHAVVFSEEVFDGSIAMEIGIRDGDIWCRMGEWDMLSYKTEDVFPIIQKAWAEEKRLVIARKIGDSYKIHSFDFPVGKMGISVVSKDIPLYEWDKLLAAYNAYCKTKQGEKK